MAPTTNRKIKLPRSCSTCHARKVKCDLLKVCTACKRHARSTGKDESLVVCVYSNGFQQPEEYDDSAIEPAREEQARQEEEDSYSLGGARLSKRRKVAGAREMLGMGLGRDVRRKSLEEERGGQEYYPSPHDFDLDSLAGDAQDFPPTPAASPPTLQFSLSFPPTTSLISPMIPLFEAGSKPARKASLHLPSFDFAHFQSQPYDSPISEFNFGSAGILSPRDSLAGGFFNSAIWYPSPS